VLSWVTLSFSVAFRRPLVIAGTFETVGATEEGSVGCEATGNTVFTEISVATSRVHLVSPFKSLLTAVHSATNFGIRLLLMAQNARAMRICWLSERDAFVRIYLAVVHLRAKASCLDPLCIVFKYNNV
jgi:hypothetical protein